MNTYTIGLPVNEVPPQTLPSGRNDTWDLCYRAAMNAYGKWVPIRFDDPTKARRLAEVARRRTTLPCDAEIRGAICFLRVRDR